MADLVVEGSDLVVRLGAVEKVEAVYLEPTIPLSYVKKVEVLDDAIAAVHGLRVGTGIPGVVAIGTFTTGDAKVFAVVHHSTPRGVRMSLDNADYESSSSAVRSPKL